MTHSIQTLLGTLAGAFRFLIVSAILIALAAFTVITVPDPIVDRLIEDDIHAQSALWQQQVIRQLEDADASFETSEVTEKDEHFLLLLVEASEAFRFHLFDAEGHIFWSTDFAKIGTTEKNSYFRDQVAQGFTYFKMEQKPLSEIQDSHDGHDHADLPSPSTEHTHMNEVGRNSFDGFFDNGAEGQAPHAHSELRQVAEIYVPYMHNGKFEGAIEFYSDVTDKRATFITRVRLSLSLIVTAVLATMLLSGLMMLRNNAKHVRQLNARNTKERDIMDQQLRLAREVQLLGELNEWLQSSRSLDELFEMVARFMTHILPNAEGSIYVYSNSRDVLDGCASWNGGSHKAHIHPDTCWGLRRGRTYEYGASEVDFTCEHAEPHDGRPYYCFPILAHGETVGLMHLRAGQGAERAFRQSKKLAQMCAEQISMAIANVRMRDQLHDQSVRDPLTGLFNRRHMTETLRKAIGTSQNSGTPLSLIAVDVDHFKKFNDNHGHDAGDMVLRAVGAALEKACDGDEVACRMGGEEFTLILPGTSNPDTLVKAEALRKSVEEITVRYGEKALPHVSISLGVAHYPQHGTLPQDLLRAADEALYDAKAKGRNQVQVAGRPALNPRDAEAEPKTEPDRKDALVEQWENDLAAEQKTGQDTGQTEEPTTALTPLPGPKGNAAR